MSGDIRRMALALRGGDLTAALPLLDALNEAGDRRRAERLHYTVGRLLAQAPNGLTASKFYGFRFDVDALFWPELCRDHLPALQEAFAAAARRLDEAQGRTPAGHAMPATTHLPDEDGNELDLTDMTTVMAALRSGFVASLPSDPGGDSEGGEP